MKDKNEYLEFLRTVEMPESERKGKPFFLNQTLEGLRFILDERMENLAGNGMAFVKSIGEAKLRAEICPTEMPLQLLFARGKNKLSYEDTLKMIFENEVFVPLADVDEILTFVDYKSEDAAEVFEKLKEPRDALRPVYDLIKSVKLQSKPTPVETARVAMNSFDKIEELCEVSKLFPELEQECIQYMVEYCSDQVITVDLFFKYTDIIAKLLEASPRIAKGFSVVKLKLNKVSTQNLFIFARINGLRGRECCIEVLRSRFEFMKAEKKLHPEIEYLRYNPSKIPDELRMEFLALLKEIDS